MAETKYSYAISTDFPGGAVNTTKLTCEINASAIVTAISRIDTVGDVIDVVFKDALSAEDRTILDGDATGPAGGLIAAHDNSADSAMESIEPVVGGLKSDFDGVSMSATASSWTKDDYSIPEDYHVQGVFAQWSGCKLGDYAWIAVIHPSSEGSLAATASLGATQADVGAGLVGYYSPAVGAAYVEFWSSDEATLLEVRKVTGTSGTNVQFTPGLSAERDTTVKVKARFNGFSPVRGTAGTDGGMRLLGSGSFFFRNELAITEKLSAGLVLSVRLRTTSEAATRELVCNPIFRKPLS